MDCSLQCPPSNCALTIRYLVVRFTLVCYVNRLFVVVDALAHIGSAAFVVPRGTTIHACGETSMRVGLEDLDMQEVIMKAGKGLVIAGGDFFDVWPKVVKKSEGRQPKIRKAESKCRPEVVRDVVIKALAREGDPYAHNYSTDQSAGTNSSWVMTLFCSHPGTRTFGKNCKQAGVCGVRLKAKVVGINEGDPHCLLDGTVTFPSAPSSFVIELSLYSDGEGRQANHCHLVHPNDFRPLPPLHCSIMDPSNAEVDQVLDASAVHRAIASSGIYKNKPRSTFAQSLAYLSEDDFVNRFWIAGGVDVAHFAKMLQRIADENCTFMSVITQALSGENQSAEEGIRLLSDVLNRVVIESTPKSLRSLTKAGLMQGFIQHESSARFGLRLTEIVTFLESSVHILDTFYVSQDFRVLGIDSIVQAAQHNNKQVQTHLIAMPFPTSAGRARTTNVLHGSSSGAIVIFQGGLSPAIPA